DERYLSLGVVQQHQFEQLARVLGREDWLVDPRFSDPDRRRENAADLLAELDAVFATRDAAVWEAELSRAGIPCGMVRTVGEAVELPGLENRDLRIPLTIPGLPDKEQVDIVGDGILGSSRCNDQPDPPPTLGQHTEEIVEWLDRDR